MRAPGDILLVACYELGHQPLAIAWPAAMLERHGYAPATLDVSVEPFDPARAARARLVAIAVPMHTALRLGVKVAERVRAVNPACHIAFYGLYATLNADYLLAHGADSVMSGEVEAPLLQLVQRLEQGSAPARSAPPHIARVDLPLPSRNALPKLQRYAHLDHDGHLKVAGYVEASRGCKHLCRHCPIPPVYGGRFFVVPEEIVLADIRQLVAAGARHITFGDPDFLNGPGHALKVARALHAEFPDVTFDITAKVEHLLKRRTDLLEFSALGCLFIVSAVESLSDEILTILDKGHTAADIHEAVRVTRAAGIALRPTWVAFTPWTSLADYVAMLDFIEFEDLIDHVDPVQFSVRLLIPPGSLLLKSDALRPHVKELVPHAFHYRWLHPDPRMEALHADVTRVVAEAAKTKEDALITFHRIRALAEAYAEESNEPPKPTFERTRDLTSTVAAKSTDDAAHDFGDLTHTTSHVGVGRGRAGAPARPAGAGMGPTDPWPWEGIRDARGDGNTQRPTGAPLRGSADPSRRPSAPPAPPREPAPPPRDRRRAPRLTEAWFC